CREPSRTSSTRTRSAKAPPSSSASRKSLISRARSCNRADEERMFLSERVKESRYRLVREKMGAKSPGAFVRRWPNAVPRDGAAFRYLTDFPNINIQLVLIFFRDEAKPPVLLVESRFQAMRAKKFSWIPDIRLSNRFLDSLIEVLREKGMDRATVGVDGLDRL